MTVKERMRKKLRLLAGLRPQSPTDEELDLIIADGIELAVKRMPMETGWKNAADKIVPNAGKYKHAGKDLTNLNSLLIQILNEADAPRPCQTR